MYMRSFRGTNKNKKAKNSNKMDKNKGNSMKKR